HRKSSCERPPLPRGQWHSPPGKGETRAPKGERGGRSLTSSHNSPLTSAAEFFLKHSDFFFHRAWLGRGNSFDWGFGRPDLLLLWWRLGRPFLAHGPCRLWPFRPRRGF